MDVLPDLERLNGEQHSNNDVTNRNISSNAIISLDSTDLATNSNTSYKQCNQVPIIDYFGSSKGNLFHTQLMIGVMVGYLMKSRLPVLLSFFNIVIRSGASFKPKSFPMFINNARNEPTNPCGSSYKLLNTKMTYTHLDYHDPNDSSSDEDDEDDDDDNDEGYSDEDTDTQHSHEAVAYMHSYNDVVDYEHLCHYSNFWIAFHLI